VATSLDGADISIYVGFVVAALVYYPLRKLAAHPDASGQSEDSEEEEAMGVGFRPAR
jgi:hypothetical protein